MIGQLKTPNGLYLFGLFGLIDSSNPKKKVKISVTPDARKGLWWTITDEKVCTFHDEKNIYCWDIWNIEEPELVLYANRQDSKNQNWKHVMINQNEKDDTSQATILFYQTTLKMWLRYIESTQSFAYAQNRDQATKFNVQTKLRITSFNLGFNVMSNTLWGTEKDQVEKCQKKYNGGWYDQSRTISSCTHNAAKLLSQYDLFGLQEVNKPFEKGLYNAVMCNNPQSDYKFLPTYYFDGSWGIVTGYNEQVTGPGQIVHIETLKFGNDVRVAQAVWFSKLKLLFINLHAPHFLNLVQSLNEFGENMKNLYLEPKHVILVGDFNDDSGKLINKTVEILGKTLRLPISTPIKTCCTDSNYKFPGDYIMVNEDLMKNIHHYGYPMDYQRNEPLMSDHDPIVMHYYT